MRYLKISLAALSATAAAAQAPGAQSLDPDPGQLDEERVVAAPVADPIAAGLMQELERERLRALIARTRFAAATDAYQGEMYRHHQFWTDVAAVMVYFLTLFGILCAAVQFRLFARLRGRSGAPVAEADEVSAGMVELPGGAKVTSPFLGVVILFLSLGFYYLYLTEVYPIKSVAELEAKRTAAPK